METRDYTLNVKAVRTTNEDLITLTIKGARATHGVSLSDFESFIDNFLAALRDYDRADRGERTRKLGHPDRRAEAVTAFRLVGFRTGSGVATIEPESFTDDEGQLPLVDVPLSLVTLRALVHDLQAERDVPEPVLVALRKACRAVGGEGSVAIDLSREGESILINEPLLERLANSREIVDTETVRTVSGRLHLLDLEPDRLGIRTAAGVEWLCRYPDVLEQRVKALLDQVVWVEGTGMLGSPLRGTMDIERIEAVGSEQSALFTVDAVGIDELLTAQRITEPQGLDSLSDPAWDDDSDDAYLAALLNK
jgi:hypothetical protein